tara:strand:- start:538 stop:756 length:219 start_codon:yes stop_codon:yes gene_type:complete
VAKNSINLKEQRRKKGPESLEETIRIASQRLRNCGADEIEEPRGLASGGDMTKILEQADDDTESDEDRLHVH